MSIYVEIVIRAPMDALWAHTQVPALHERWDLRFSEITYLPRSSDSDPQRFRYTTRMGWGLEVAGEGETLGQRELNDGGATSALRFASDDRISLIREGRGYWKYVPTAQGIRFLTSYDYGTRFGAAGRVFDRCVFRPLMGWATAWSFDRLRLWLEKSVDPALALRQTLVHCMARLALVSVFAYQGLVPKLILRHSDEIAMFGDLGVPVAPGRFLLAALGVSELILAAVLLIGWCRRWPAWICLASMTLATIVVGVSSPQFFGSAFNAFSLNLAVASLAVIDLLVLAAVPSASRCLRRPRPEKRSEP
ncbi:MAG TPA: DoxX-like family protein [Vicinamibacterales bacterium]